MQGRATELQRQPAHPLLSFLTGSSVPSGFQGPRITTQKPTEETLARESELVFTVLTIRSNIKVHDTRSRTALQIRKVSDFFQQNSAPLLNEENYVIMASLNLGVYQTGQSFSKYIMSS